MSKIKAVASKDMVKNAVGDQFDELAEPGNVEVDYEHPLAKPVVDELREIFDPEIPVNIYELGLIYKVAFSKNDDGTEDVYVEMTLTSPACPVAQDMPVWVRDAILPVKGVGGVDVNIIFDPPWGPDMMAETAKLQLNMF
jgi:FeS assembly SUF system protein